MREQKFQSDLMVSLSRLPGVRVWRQPAGKHVLRDTSGRVKGAVQCAPVGAADITGIVGPEGWALQIECKLTGKERTTEQESWAAMARAKGAIYLLAVCDPTRGVEAEVARVTEELAATLAGRRHACSP